MNISLTSTLNAFKPPAPPASARPGAAPQGAAAALLETGLQAQLINKDTTIPQAVKDEKLKALSPQAQQALAMVLAETEAASKSDLVDSTDGAQEDVGPDPATGATTDAASGGPVDGEAGALGDSSATTASPTTYAQAVGKDVAPVGDQVKGAMVDVQA